MKRKTGKNHALVIAWFCFPLDHTNFIFTTRNLSMAFETNSEVKPSSNVLQMLPGMFFQLGK